MTTRPRTDETGPAPEPRTRLERTLLLGVRGCLGAVLFTPLVVDVDAAYSATTAKALFAHTAIEIALVLWAALALANPKFLPPRSRLLAVLGLGVAWSIVAAAFGSGWQLSLWSSYSRMYGLVGAVHWFAFVVLVVAAFRPLARLRTLLSIHLGASIVVAALAILNAYELPLPLYGALREKDAPRIGGTIGNAIPLGVYSVLSVALALTMLASEAGRTKAPAAGKPRYRRLALRLLWLIAIPANLWAFTLTGSLTAAMAALGGIGALSVAAAWRGTGLWRRSAIAVLALVAIGVAAVAGTFLLAEPAPDDTYRHPFVKRIAEVGVDTPNALSRWFAWQAGLAGFVDKPLFGWGPEHFLVPFGRYASESARFVEPHADAHNVFVEKLATEGLPGLAFTIALWLVAGAVVWRAGTAAPAGDRAFVLGIGTALACYLVQCQTANWNATSNMAFLLLLAVVAQLETQPAKEPGRLGRLAQGRPSRLGLLAGALAFAVAGLAANLRIHEGAVLFGVAGRTAPYPYNPPPVAEQAQRALLAFSYYQRAIDAFPPLANFPRRFLLDDLEVNWRALRARHPAEAKRWLAYAEAEAAAATASQPQSWLLQQSLARLYLRVATTDRKYQALAKRLFERSAELAPNMPVYKPPPK